jgi:hypothetical protein
MRLVDVVFSLLICGRAGEAFTCPLELEGGVVGALFFLNSSFEDVCFIGITSVPVASAELRCGEYVLALTDAWWRRMTCPIFVRFIMDVDKAVIPPRFNDSRGQAVPVQSLSVMETTGELFEIGLAVRMGSIKGFV